MKTLIFMSLLCGLAPLLQAQQPAQPTPRPTLPSGPLLEKAPDFAQWTITTKGGGTPIAEPAGAAPSPAAGETPSAPGQGQGGKPAVDSLDQQTTVIKTKPLRFEQTTASGGRKTVRWCTPELQVTDTGSGTPVVSFAGNRSDQFSIDYSKTDFAGFDWISARNYEGIQKVSGQDCLVFRDVYKVDGKALETERPLSTVACIALESRLPVALQLGDEVRTYQFGPPPTAMLTLPPEVDALVNKWRASIRRASLPVAKP